jgi:hypothetical protein
MAVQSLGAGMDDASHCGHLLGDVPVLSIVAAALAFFTPRGVSALTARFILLSANNHHTFFFILVSLPFLICGCIVFAFCGPTGPSQIQR